MSDMFFRFETPDGINLIFHKRYQRRNHNGRTFRHQSRQLIAEGLPPSRWHYHKHIITIEKVTDNFKLVSFESIESEVSPECFVYLDGIRHRSEVRKTRDACIRISFAKIYVYITKLNNFYHNCKYFDNFSIQFPRYTYTMSDILIKNRSRYELTYLLRLHSSI